MESFTNSFPARRTNNGSHLRPRRPKTIRIKTLLIILIGLVLLAGIVFGILYYLNKRPLEQPSKFILTEPPKFIYNIYEGNNKLKHPLNIAVDRVGKTYISNNGFHSIEVFSKNLKGEFSIGGQGQDAGKIMFPYGLAFLPGGNLLITETGNYRVQEFKPDGTYVKTVVGQPNNIGLIKPGPIQVDSKGNIYIGDLSGNQVIVLDSKGKLVRRISNVIYPHGIAVDEVNNKLYVSDSGKVAVKIFALDKGGDTPIKSIDTSTPDTRFSMVRGLAVDRHGRLYVADTLFSVIRVFDKDGEYLFSFGRKGNGDGEFLYPNGVSVDSNGKIYIADWSNNRVQIWGY